MCYKSYKPFFIRILIWSARGKVLSWAMESTLLGAIGLSLQINKQICSPWKRESSQCGLWTLCTNTYFSSSTLGGISIIKYSLEEKETCSLKCLSQDLPGLSTVISHFRVNLLVWIYKTNISLKRALPSIPISSKLVKATDTHLPKERVWSKCEPESHLFCTAQVSKQRICTRKYVKHRCSDSHQQGHVKPHREDQASNKQNLCPTHAITSVCETESDPKDSSEHLSLIYWC